MQPEYPFAGLTKEQVRANRLKHGNNVMAEDGHHPFLSAIKDVISEPIFILLVFASAIYFILGEYNEGVIMLLALFFIAAISLYQENRSRNAVNALKKLASPTAKVIRDGETLTIPAEEIVMADIIIVEDGNLVPADAQILKANDFTVNESLLTGESLPLSKDSSGEDNIIYQGSTVMSGSCIAQVISIGKQTALGKIGQSMHEVESSKTPLQLQIKSFIRNMLVFGLMAFAIVWGVNYYLSNDFFQALLHGLTLTMSVLPEEIPVAFSTFMALGAYHLYKKKVIARSPHTVETLGAATVICVDKTGTITENKMELVAIYDFKKQHHYDFSQQHFEFSPVLEYAMWASETEPFDHMEKSIHQVYGNIAPYDKRKDFAFVHEYPLSGDPPIMTHVFSNSKGEDIIAVKGSVEGVLKQSILNEVQRSEVLDLTKHYAQKGYRVLAVGSSVHDLAHLPASQHDLTFDFLGLLAFYDPPKPGMKETLQQFYRAGIQVKMITGDYPETAMSIARQIDFKFNDKMLSGKEVMQMDLPQLRQEVGATQIFARMFPQAKLKVVEALKANAEVVAMTGDGVNDGPALKAAHIGIAMGKRGSEVAKNAAALILMDDDLTHMNDAVELGRRIYENLKKAIQYIISIHIPIILIVALPLLLLWKYSNIFSPIHVIFLELIMGPTCSIVFEREPIEADSMQKPPRKMTATFFSWRELSISIIQGLMITAGCLSLGYYFMMEGNSESFVRTVIYTTLIFSNLFLTLVNRSFYYSVFTTLRYRNILVPLILSISLIVLFLSIYVAPVQQIFQFEALHINVLLQCLLVAFVAVIWVEAYKIYRRRT